MKNSPVSSTVSMSLRQVIAAVIACAAVSGSALADGQVKPDGQVKLGTIGNTLGEVDVVVSGDSIEAVAPVQANLEAVEPQSIISRAFIENQVPPTGNFNSIIGVAPSMATTPSPNGPGLSDTATTMRGFKDNQYNVTWDGIPFGDTNDPSHHSTSYFPSSVIGGVVIERGPGNASNVGQATFGGSVNLFSKTPSDTRATEIYESRGNWNTNLFGVGYESGRMANVGDATLQFNYQKLQSDGYLKYNDISSDNLLMKFTRKLGDSTKFTAFAQYNDEFLHLPDNWVGPTAAQIAVYGIGYGGLNNDPHSMAYAGYNHIRKTTDMEYIRLQTDWGNGWTTDNNLYTYAYKNWTIAGDSPDQAGDPAQNALCTATGTVVEAEVCSGHKGTLPGGVPGNDKLNQYRVQGDIFKATYQTTAGLLRLGAWLETSHTHREKYYLDLYTGHYTGKIKNDQGSSWDNYQPFAEFEWAAADGLTVTPGVKFISFTRNLAAAQNNGNGPFYGSYKYTDTLPFLTVNKRFGAENSLYFQYAQGFQIPTLDYTYVTNPGNTPKPQTTSNYQIGFVHKDRKLTWDADVYLIDFKNLVLSQFNGTQTIFYSAGGAQYKGIETEIAYQIGGGLSVFANGSINSARFVNINDLQVATDQNGSGVSSAYTYNGAPPTNGSIPYAPNSTAAFGVVYQSGPVNATINYVRTGHQYAVPGEVSAYLIPAFDNIDMNAGYTFSNLGNGVQSLKLAVSVYNVANKRNLTLTTIGPDEFNYQAPRSFMVTARAKF